MNHEKSIEDEVRRLLKEIHELKGRVPDSRPDLNEQVKNAEEDAMKMMIKLMSDELQRQDEEIKELRRQVSRLNEELAKLTTGALSADTIDAGEAMQIMEYHVATFVLPETEEIGDGGIHDMLEYVKNDNAAKETWDVLTEKCEMRDSWTPRHKNVPKILMRFRNVEAHHKKFDFERLQQIMFKKRPFHKKECEDIIRMFRKVNHLMKFGIIASDFMENEAKQRKCTETSKEVLEKSARKLLKESAEMWARKNVLYLQDIKLTEAKEHVAQYFPHVDDIIWSNTISTILVTNRPRLGKLVEDKEAEVLKKVVTIFVKKPRCKTLEELIKFSRGSQWKEDRREEGDRWNSSIKYIWWTATHNNAMKAMKDLLPDDQRKDVDPLPLHVAKLQVADFVGDDLWKASSEILKIFEWDKKSDWENA